MTVVGRQTANIVLQFYILLNAQDVSPKNLKNGGWPLSRVLVVNCLQLIPDFAFAGNL